MRGSTTLAGPLKRMGCPLVGIGDLGRAERTVVFLELADRSQARPDSELLPGSISQPGAIAHAGLRCRSNDLGVEVRRHRDGALLPNCHTYDGSTAVGQIGGPPAPLRAPLSPDPEVWPLSAYSLDYLVRHVYELT